MKAPETEALEIVQAHPSRRLSNALLRRLVQAADVIGQPRGLRKASADVT